MPPSTNAVTAPALKQQQQRVAQQQLLRMPQAPWRATLRRALLPHVEFRHRRDMDAFLREAPAAATTATTAAAVVERRSRAHCALPSLPLNPLEAIVAVVAAIDLLVLASFMPSRDDHLATAGSSSNGGGESSANAVLLATHHALSVLSALLWALEVACVGLPSLSGLSPLTVLDAAVVAFGVAACVVYVVSGNAIRLLGLYSIVVLRLPMLALRPFASSLSPRFREARRLAAALAECLRCMLDAFLLLAVVVAVAGIGMCALYRGSFAHRCVSNDLFFLLLPRGGGANATSNASATAAAAAAMELDVFALPTQSLLGNASAAAAAAAFLAAVVGINASGSADGRPTAAQLLLWAEWFVCEGAYDRHVGLAANLGCGTSQVCRDPHSVTSEGFRCPFGYTCAATASASPLQYEHYDNALSAFFTTFATVSLSQWYVVVNWLLDSNGYVAAALALLTILVGAFFVLPLVTARIALAFRSQLDPAAGNDNDSDDDDGQLQQRRRQSADEAPPHSAATLARDLDAPLLLPPPSADDASRGPESNGAADGGRRRRLADARPTTLQRVRSWVSRCILQRRSFILAVPIAITFNILLLCCDYYGAPADYVAMLDVANVAFTVFYTLELALRVLGTEWGAFTRSKLNFLDVVIVVASWADVAVVSVELPFLRSFRALRVAKLLKFFPGVYLWIKVLLHCTVHSVWLVAVFGLFIAAFAAVGLHFLGGRLCGLVDGSGDDAGGGPLIGGWCAGRPRANFDSFGEAFLATFQVATGDSWTEVMRHGMLARPPGLAAALFIAFYLVANSVLLRSFIGILLGARESLAARIEAQLERVCGGSLAERRMSENERLAQEMMAVSSSGGSLFLRDALGNGQDADDAALGGAQFRWTDSSTTTSESSGDSDDDEYGRSGFRAFLRFPSIQEVPNMRERVDAESDAQLSSASGMPPSAAAASGAGAAKSASSQRRQPRRNRRAKHPLDHYKLPDHRLRRALRFALARPQARALIACVVVGSTACMALQSPIAAPDSSFASSLRVANSVFSALLVVEWVANCVAFGFGVGEQAYLRRSGWHVLDTVVVALVVVDSASQYTRAASLGLRAAASMSALRGLRVVREVPSMRRLFRDLLSSLPHVINVMVVLLLLFVAWGLMGVQLLKGTFYSCTNATLTTEVQCAGAGQEWLNAPNHFDHIGAAISSLFVLTSMDGWTSIMWSGIDGIAPGVAPRYNSHPWMSAYFILFIIVSGIFFTNLLTTIVIDALEQARFKRHRLQHSESHDGSGGGGGGGSLWMTPLQLAWGDSHRRVAHTVPPIYRPVFAGGSPPDRAHRALWRLVTHDGFGAAMQAVIVLNMVALCLDRRPQDEATASALRVINYVFVAVFGAECALKVAALRAAYFRSKWHLWDLFVLLASVVGVVAELLLDESHRGFIDAFRAVRVLRLLRTVRTKQSVRDVMRTLLAAFPTLVSVAALMVVLLLCLACFAKALLGRVKWQGAIDAHNNFQSIPAAMLLLLRVTFGGGASQVSAAFKLRPPACDPNIGECPLSVAPGVVFTLTTACGLFLIQSLFAAVLVDAFRAASDGGRQKLRLRDARRFVDEWAAVDPLWTLSVRTSQVPALLCRCGIGNALTARFVVLRIFYSNAQRRGDVGGFGELRFFKFAGLREDAEGRVTFLELLHTLLFLLYGARPPVAAVVAPLCRKMCRKLLAPAPFASSALARLWTARGSAEDAAAATDTFPAYRRLAARVIETAWLARRRGRDDGGGRGAVATAAATSTAAAATLTHDELLELL